MGKLIYILGDKFTDFYLNNKETMSVSEFIAIYKEKSLPPCVDFRIGQGISTEELRNIWSILCGNKRIIDKYTPEKKELVHKVESKNVIISKSLAVLKNKFYSYLRIDDQCAEISDHITGQHIQGMVIIEAARQMMLSTTEKFLIRESLQGRVWIILHKMDVNFISFLFPLEVKIECEVKTVSRSAEKQKYSVSINFVQQDEVCSVVKILFSVYEKEKIKIKEKSLARRIVGASVYDSMDRVSQEELVQSEE